jgi:hypothetical protein
LEISLRGIPFVASDFALFLISCEYATVPPFFYGWEYTRKVFVNHSRYRYLE